MRQHEVILVTGGTGFVGSQVVKKLLDRGDHVVLSGTHTNKFLPDGVDYVLCNLLERHNMENLLNKYRPSHCIHLAWTLSQDNYLSSSLNWQWLMATLNLLESFARFGGKRFIGVGTCFEYSPVDTPRQEENTPAFPPSPYGQSKASLSQASRLAGQALGISTLWARIFYPIGPGDSYRRLFGGACSALFYRKPFETGIKEPIWDLIDIRDIGTILAELLHSNVEGVINVGKGHGEHIRHLLEELFNRYHCSQLLSFKKPDLIQNESQRNKLRGNMDFLVADTTKLKQFLPNYRFIAASQSLEDTIEALKKKDITLNRNLNV